MRVRTKVIREGRALYLLEDVALPEGQPLIVTVETVADDGLPDEDDIPVQETLADVLGFDPEDEDKARELAESQRQALLELAAYSTASSGLVDVSERHDYYIYVEPYEKRQKGKQ